ncbi:MAG: PH domain-containing protein [Candidatus Bathyarchaeota archaeon]|nr:PH domain-containing protein [Candidatus Bathyarchaeota archaeon]
MSEEVKSLPIMRRRMLLGYFIPAVNLPLFLYNVYQTIIHLQEGMQIGSQPFWEDIIVLVSTLFLTWAIPRFFPVYVSKYILTPEGFKLSRLLRSTVTIPYKDINRVEVYIRVDEEISQDANEYATNQSANLRKSGFKFIDYTNAESIIMNMYVENAIYMISPEKPKTLLKELKRRNKRLTARIIELTQRGKKIQELN